MLAKLGIITVFLISYLSSSIAYLETDSWLNIELSHALNPSNLEEFTYRGNVSISSLDSGLSSSVQDALSKEQMNGFVTLARNKQFYRMKATVMYPSGMKNVFLTSTPACSLIQSNLNDVVWVSIDSLGFVNSVSITGALLPMDVNDCSTKLLSMDQFNTDVLIKHTELAPVPDTASFLQKVEREREAREREVVRDHRTFFAKYWMYIVPAVLILFITGAANQEPAK